jgi:hypothetical protein
MPRHMLAIYLNDHLAGATGGHELAKRSLGNNRGTEYEAELSSIAAEIEEDKDTLERLMRELGVARSPWKTGAAWVAEKVGRGKLNGTLLGYSALSRLEELEALRSGVIAKAAMWAALADAAADVPGIRKQEMRRLLRRAERQAERLEALRLRAAGDALRGSG